MVFAVLGGSAVAAEPRWRLGSEVPDGLGDVVTGVGDVNGDGYDDVLIGRYASPGYTGRAELYLGSPAGLSGPGVTIDGAAPRAFLGAEVAAAGDVDGDPSRA